MSIHQPSSSAPSQLSVAPSDHSANLLQLLKGLCQPTTGSGNADPKAEGLESLLTLIPRFDLGDWSACDTAGTRASPEQHDTYIHLLAKIAEETGDQRVLGWHDRFTEYRDIADGKIGQLKLPWKSGQPAGDNYHQRIARSYLAQRVHKPIWQAEHNAVASLLDRLPRGQSVLDVPFGTGRFVPLYLARDMAVTGVDISDSMLNEARRALGSSADAVTMLRADASRLPFEEQAFDGVVSVRFLGSIIPFSQVAPVLREFRRVVRTWAIFRLNARFIELPPLVDEPRIDAVMGYRLNIDQLQSLCNECGWRIEESVVVGRKDSGARQGEQRIVFLRTV